MERAVRLIGCGVDRRPGRGRAVPGRSRFRNRLGTLAGEALLTPIDVQGAIRGILRFSVERATREGSPPGCLMVCITPLVDDEEVHAYLVGMENQARATIERGSGQE